MHYCGIVMGRIEAEWTSVDVSEQVYTRLKIRYDTRLVFSGSACTPMDNYGCMWNSFEAKDRYLDTV